MRICCKGTQNAFESAEMALWFALFGSERPRKNQSERSRKNLKDLKVNVSDTYLARGFGMPVDLRTCHWCFSSFSFSLFIPHATSPEISLLAAFQAGVSWLQAIWLAALEKKSVEGRRNCCKSLFSCSSSHWLWLPSTRQPC